MRQADYVNACAVKDLVSVAEESNHMARRRMADVLKNEVGSVDEDWLQNVVASLTAADEHLENAWKSLDANLL